MPDLIWNERIKMLATAFNTFGLGAILTGVVAPAANGLAEGALYVVAWLIFGALSTGAAQVILGRLRT